MTGIEIAALIAARALLVLSGFCDCQSITDFIKITKPLIL